MRGIRRELHALRDFPSIYFDGYVLWHGRMLNGGVEGDVRYHENTSGTAFQFHYYLIEY